MHEVVWTLGADADVQGIYERFENWEEGAGDRFYAEVLSCVEILKSYPELGASVKGLKMRRVLVFNRNYGLYYTIEHRRLVLHALIDLRQDPKGIRKRIGS
jgi:plasmid stabilization system protein ParE